jgi:hypothetical protein
MRQPHRRFFGETLAQLPADLFRAPTLPQQLGDDTAEVVIGLDAPVTTPSATRARATVRLKWAVARPPAVGPVAPQLPGDR